MDHSPDIDSYAPHHTVEGVQEDLKEPKLKIESEKKKIESDYHVRSRAAQTGNLFFSYPPGVS